MNTTESSILIVDDEESIRHLLRIQLGSRYACAQAASADDAIKLLRMRTFDLVLADITMPGTSGLDLCLHVSTTYPDTVVLMVSGLSDIQSAIRAMQHGAFDYILKPFDLAQVALSVERAMDYHSLLSFKHNHERKLEETVRRRTEELHSLNVDLNDMFEILYSNYRATLHSLAKAVETKDVETRGHAERVVAYCLTLGRRLGLSERDLIALEQGALLHDIGKIGVRDSILLKAGPLTDDQWIEMRAHIDHGLGIIEGIDFLTGARAVIGQHHEKFDGSGYPRGLAGDSIHIHARIFAVADAFDALTSDRPYRAACAYPAACKEIIASSGTHFDPRVVDVFLTIPASRLADIRREVMTHTHSEAVIEERELRSFILSLRRPGVPRKVKVH
jgi:putative two-component system response regulator